MTILGESLFKTKCFIFCLCVLVTVATVRELVGGHRQQKAKLCACASQQQPTGKQPSVSAWQQVR
jgi:hypothetical protein